MKRVLSVVLVVVGISLLADSARAQNATAPAPAVRYVQVPAGYYYSNGYYYRTTPASTAPVASPGTYYYTTPAGYYDHNGVLRGPSGAMEGRAQHYFDPTGRGVQLYKPWLKPIH
jgi:hypothetical protein